MVQYFVAAVTVVARNGLATMASVRVLNPDVHRLFGRPATVNPKNRPKLKSALPAWAGVLPERAIPTVGPPDCAGLRESSRLRLAENRLAIVG